MDEQIIYPAKTPPFAGMRWAEISRKARELEKNLRRFSRRRSHVRSAYFDKQKVFLGAFWQHLHEKKNLRDKTRRLKYLPCAVELIQNSRLDPESRDHPNDSSQLVHRFTGIVSNGMLFRVQIKEDKRTHEKHLISVFPVQP